MTSVCLHVAMDGTKSDCDWKESKEDSGGQGFLVEGFRRDDEFLGVQITRDMDGRALRISQRRYLLDILIRFNMSDCKPSSVPKENRLRLEKGEESQRTLKPYRELIGCLMYVVLTTRPDLSATVDYFS